MNFFLKKINVDKFKTINLRKMSRNNTCTIKPLTSGVT